jgi:hypothetical protein
MQLNWDIPAILPPDFQAQLQATLVAVMGGLVLLLVAAVIAFLGWLLALLLSRGAQRVLALVGLDAPLARLQARGHARSALLPSRIVGYTVFWSMFLAACIVALRVVGLDLIPSLTARLQDVVPRVLTSTLVLVTGIPVALGVARLLVALLPPATAGAARLRHQTAASVLVGFVALLALEQLGLAAQLVVAVGVAAVGAAGLALALAFGLGCRDLARDLVVEYLRASESDTGTERP